MVLDHGLVCIQVYTHSLRHDPERTERSQEFVFSNGLFNHLFVCPDFKVQHSPVSLVASPRLGGVGGGPRRSVA